jgi:hypothetical protein
MFIVEGYINFHCILLKHSVPRKSFKLQFADLMGVYTVYSVSTSYNELFMRKAIKFDLGFM